MSRGTRAAPPSWSGHRIQLSMAWSTCLWKSTPPSALGEERQRAGATGLHGDRSHSVSDCSVHSSAPFPFLLEKEESPFTVQMIIAEL
ncbi:uncharacterized [Tachysurus ichikawai]